MSKKKAKRLPRKPTEYAKESHVVRLSPELFRAIKDLGHRNESYDNIIRRVLGMPVLKYAKDSAQTLFALQTFLFADEALAYGEAIKLKVRQKLKQTPPVVKVRTAW